MKNVPDEFELIPCGVCDSKHLKAICPRLHFIPYNETIIHKYLHREKSARNAQAKFRRKPKHRANAFKIYKITTSHVQKLGAMLNSKRRRTDAKISISSNSENDSDMRLANDMEIMLEREIKQI
jgi:hypothetical protein